MPVAYFADFCGSLRISQTYTYNNNNNNNNNNSNNSDVARGCVGDSLRSLRLDPPTRSRAPVAALVRGGTTQKTRDHIGRARARQTSSHSAPRRTCVSAESDHLWDEPRLINIVSGRRRRCTEVQQTSQNRPFPSQIAETFRLRRAKPHQSPSF